MYREISNLVEKMVHRAMVGSPDQPTSQADPVSNKDDLVAIRKYFADLEQSKDEEEEVEEVHKSDVKYLTMKPVKDMDEERYHTGKAIISGKLWKQGRRVNRWKERYFILRETGISYYSNPEAGDLILESVEKSIESDVPNVVQIGETTDDQQKLPRTRGNMFFADIVTPTGHVVEDLNKLKNKALLGGKQNCFCVQTEENIYILSANSPEEKKLWLYNIDEAYAKFVKQQIRKVALMNLSWEFYEDNTQGEKDNTPEETSKRMKKVVKATLERTKSRFVKNDSKNEDIVLPPPEPIKSGTRKKKKRNRGAMPRSVENNLRESFGRLSKEDRRRISAQRVGNIKAEAEESLRSAFEERVANRQKLLVKAKVFARWQTYVQFKKSLKGAAKK
mmetsp:Transcript_18249/g.21088  ORF Transcript_18249/g.21088 Transcript_18249/m.21088 type:complete len:391 (+) Transcript_18249:152-1324(+)